MLVFFELLKLSLPPLRLLLSLVESLVDVEELALVDAEELALLEALLPTLDLMGFFLNNK